jgi:hypothetical protein
MTKFYSRGKSRRIRRTGHASRGGHNRNAYGTLVPKSEGKRQLGRPRQIRKNNIEIYQTENV